MVDSSHTELRSAAAETQARKLESEVAREAKVNQANDAVKKAGLDSRSKRRLEAGAAATFSESNEEASKQPQAFEGATGGRSGDVALAERRLAALLHGGSLT